MAAVQVTVKNNSGQTVTLTLDDETDAERIEYFQTLKRRGDIVDVSVKKPATASHSTRAQHKPGGGSGGTGDVI
jgi:hypothetical protein